MKAYKNIRSAENILIRFQISWLLKISMKSLREWAINSCILLPFWIFSLKKKWWRSEYFLLGQEIVKTATTWPRWMKCWSIFRCIMLVIWPKPLSFKNNSVCLRTAVESHVSHKSSAHVARSGRLRTDAVICNWKGL